MNTCCLLYTSKGHVITVVGAGGNRDKGKRPLMAQEAVKQSDTVIITSDNRRFEEPQEIINDMLAGLTKEDKMCIRDREWDDLTHFEGNANAFRILSVFLQIGG